VDVTALEITATDVRSLKQPECCVLTQTGPVPGERVAGPTQEDVKQASPFIPMCGRITSTSRAAGIKERPPGRVAVEP
jgi:hypothetical protein